METDTPSSYDGALCTALVSAASKAADIVDTIRSAYTVSGTSTPRPTAFRRGGCDMAKRVVRAVGHSEGKLSALCNPGYRWSPRSVVDVIGDIRRARHYYVVRVLPFLPWWEVDVQVVEHGPGAPFLRTGPDGFPLNNLSALPDCSQVPVVPPMPVRRDIATVPAEERARFRDAILALIDRLATPGDPVNLWFKQDQIHKATHVHDQASFLPWHRELINRFEAALQEIDEDVALHYWDWTTDPRRAPDGAGGFVDLMTDGFMGSPQGLIGAPFTRFFDATQPEGLARDEDLVRADPILNASKPPRGVTRKLVASGRGPRDVTLDDFEWTASPRRDSDGDVRVQGDDLVVGAGLRGDVADQFERFWLELSRSHGWAHAYIGGDIGQVPGSRATSHTSFRDPFVFLLHSNVDRLWASWQLSPDGFDARDISPRLDPERIYGDLALGRGKFEEASKEADNVFDPQQREAARADVAKSRADAQRELGESMRPWDGRGGILPWSGPGTAQPRTPKHADVLRPAMYDRYARTERLAMSWTTVRLGRQLANGDRILATITPGAVPANTVEFVLDAAPNIRSWKGLRVSDGEAQPSSWLIETKNDTRQASISLWAHQVGNGQALLFHKRGGWLSRNRQRQADRASPRGPRLAPSWVSRHLHLGRRLKARTYPEPVSRASSRHVHAGRRVRPPIVFTVLGSNIHLPDFWVS